MGSNFVEFSGFIKHILLGIMKDLSVHEVAEWLKARGFVTAETQLWQDARKFGSRGGRSMEEQQQERFSERCGDWSVVHAMYIACDKTHGGAKDAHASDLDVILG